MDSLTEIKKNVIDLLKSSPMLGEIEIVEEFVGAHRLPKDKPILTVGIHSVELIPAGLGGYFGENRDGVYRGGWAKITLGFDCFVDQTNKEQRSQLIFERLCQQLILCELGITKVASSPISPAKGGFVASFSATAELQAVVSSAVPKELVSDFILKRSD